MVSFQVQWDGSFFSAANTGVGIFHVNPQFQNTSVLWNTRWTWKSPSLAEYRLVLRSQIPDRKKVVYRSPHRARFSNVQKLWSVHPNKTSLSIDFQYKARFRYGEQTVSPGCIYARLGTSCGTFTFSTIFGPENVKITLKNLISGDFSVVPSSLVIGAHLIWL